MKKILFYTICCLFTLTISSCSEDDNNIDIEKPNGSGPVIPDEEESTGVIPTTDKTLGIRFPITSITTEEGISAFDYQNNKMVLGTSRFPYYGWRNFDFQIKENPLRIDITLYDDYGESVNTTESVSFTNIKTNKYGFITEAQMTFKSKEETNSGKIEVVYNSKGYITKQKYYEQFVGGYNLLTTDFIWKNDNLTQVSIYYEEKDNYDDYTEYQYESDIYTFEYSSNPSLNPNTGIYFWRDLYEDDVFYDFLWYSGLFGKTSKNIPISVTDKFSWKEVVSGNERAHEEGEEHTDVETFYNQNGSISSIRYSIQNFISSSEEDSEEIYQYQHIYYYGYDAE